MKCEVIRKFIETKTGKVWNIGDTYECSKERFNEVQAAGKFLKVIPQPKKKLKQLKNKEGNFNNGKNNK